MSRIIKSNSKSKEKLITFVLIPLFCLTGCTHYYYVPTVQNVPLFREKNEYRISGFYGFGDESNCVEIQAAGSVTDKIGIMTDFMHAQGGEIAADRDWGRGNYFDAAVGYFKPIERFGVFEVYGGLGGSKQHHQYESSNYSSGTSTSSYGGTSDLSFRKLFIQPSFGVTFKGIDVAVSSRFCRLYFNKVDNNIYPLNNQYDYDDLTSIARKGSYYFLEPALTLRAGWKYAKVQIQASTSSYTNNNDHIFEEYHLSFGLFLTITDRYKNEAR